MLLEESFTIGQHCIVGLLFINIRWVDGTESNLNNGGQDRDLHCIYLRKKNGQPYLYRVIVQRYNAVKYVGSAKTLEEAKVIRDAYLRE